jgi:hypothetical protein
MPMTRLPASRPTAKVSGHQLIYSSPSSDGSNSSVLSAQLLVGEGKHLFSLALTVCTALSMRLTSRRLPKEFFFQQRRKTYRQDLPGVWIDVIPLKSAAHAAFMGRMRRGPTRST